MNKAEKIKDWISKTQDGLMDTQCNFGCPEHEGAYHILCNLDAYIDSLQEEPVINDLEEAATKYARKQVANPDYPTYNDEYEMECAFEAGAQWQKKHLEMNRIRHCDNITEDQYNLETEFLDGWIEKYDRLPTFLDAIEYGMKLQKQQDQSTIELAEDHAMLAGMEKMKQEMIDKFFKWLAKHWREYVWLTDNDVIHFGHWEYDFKKAMEE